MTGMPYSRVVDGARRATPEWREYLGRIEASIKAIETLGFDEGALKALETLKERLAKLKGRIAALPDKAHNPHERLVKWRGTVTNSTGATTFEHNLGTRHVFWQIRRSDGQTMGWGGDVETEEINETAVRVYIGLGTFDALIYGVISDRY